MQLSLLILSLDSGTGPSSCSTSGQRRRVEIARLTFGSIEPATLVDEHGRRRQGFLYHFRGKGQGLHADDKAELPLPQKWLSIATCLLQGAWQRSGLKIRFSSLWARQEGAGICRQENSHYLAITCSRSTQRLLTSMSACISIPGGIWQRYGATKQERICVPFSAFYGTVTCPQRIFTFVAS